MRRNRWGPVLGLAAMCGARTIAPLAVVPAVNGGRAPGLLGRRWAQPLLVAWATAEFAMDKTRWIPARTRPLLAAGRAAAGAAMVAAFVSGRGRTATRTALVGAVAALAGTFASHGLRERARRWTGWPSAALGALEDALVVVGAVPLARQLA